MFALRATTLGAALVAAALAGCSSSVPLSDGKATVETRNPNAGAGAGAGTADRAFHRHLVKCFGHAVC